MGQRARGGDWGASPRWNVWTSAPFLLAARREVVTKGKPCTGFLWLHSIVKGSADNHKQKFPRSAHRQALARKGARRGDRPMAVRRHRGEKSVCADRGGLSAHLKLTS